MTPQEKAEDLRSSFSDVLFDEIEGYYQKNHIIKLCALIAVDELIYETHFEVPNIRQRYWIEVKQELEKL